MPGKDDSFRVGNLNCTKPYTKVRNITMGYNLLEETQSRRMAIIPV